MEENTKKLVVAQQLLTKLDALKSTNIKSLILYGSVALKTAKKQSDIDLMLLLDYTDMNLLKKVKSICEETQETSQEQIALSFNTVSNFLNHMMQGHQMYLNMCLHGTCLMNSLVFDGIKNIITNSKIPPQEEIVSHSKAFIQNQTNVFLGRTMTDFIASIDAIVRRYLHFKEFGQSKIDNWKAYEALLNHNDFSNLIHLHLSQFEPVLSKFYSIKHAFSPVQPPNFEVLETIDLAQLLNCIRFIQNNSN